MSGFNLYQTPPDYSIPSPYGPRQHNWQGGYLDEGSQYHGPNYVRPSYRMPWIAQPLNGAADIKIPVPKEFEDFAIVAWFSEKISEYPEVGGAFGAEMSRRHEAGESEEKFIAALALCIREHANVDAPEAPVSEAQAQRVSQCFKGEGGGIKLGLILPIVALVGVVGFVLLKKKGRK